MNRADSRVVLIGTPFHTHADEHLPDVPAVENNLVDLAEVLTDAGLGGFAGEHCVTVKPGSSLEQVGDALSEAAEQAKDLLLVYFSGHGLLDSSGGLHLALAGTKRNRLGYTALAYETLRATCLESRAATRVLILDSCFSGRAIGKPLGDAQLVIDALNVDGTYILTSAPPNSTALHLEGERNTAFTGRLLDLLRTGHAEAGDELAMGFIYEQLHAQLKQEGLPLPQQRGTAKADKLPLVRNRRPKRPTPAELPEDLQHSLDSHRVPIRLGAVAELAKWLEDPDPARVLAARNALQNVADNDNPTVSGEARKYLAETAPVNVEPPTHPAAEPPNRVAEAAPAAQLRPRPVRLTIDSLANQAHVLTQRVTDPEVKGPVLAKVAEAVAVTNPHRAADIARAITDPALSLQAQIRVAAAAAAADVPQATAVARAIADTNARASALADVAGIAADTSPETAMQIAQSITEPSLRNEALVSIAKRLATIDTGKAVLVARSIIDPVYGSLALAGVVAAIAMTEPDLAAELASDITDPWWSVHATTDVINAMVGTTFVRASSLAQRAVITASYIANPTLSARALAGLASIMTLAGSSYGKALADRAALNARTLTDPLPKAQALAEIAHVLLDADPGQTTLLADHAFDIALGIPDAWSKAYMLTTIAEVMAKVNPSRASDIVIMIDVPYRRVASLSKISEIVAQTDRLAATELTDTAARIAEHITSDLLRGYALADVAASMAATNLNRAMELVETITAELAKNQAIAMLAERVAEVDSDQATAIALTITDPLARDGALFQVSANAAQSDTMGAFSIAQQIIDPGFKALALAEIAIILGEQEHAQAAPTAK